MICIIASNGARHEGHRFPVFPVNSCIAQGIRTGSIVSLGPVMRGGITLPFLRGKLNNEVTFPSFAPLVPVSHHHLSEAIDRSLGCA